MYTVTHTDTNYTHNCIDEAAVRKHVEDKYKNRVKGDVVGRHPCLDFDTRKFFFLEIAKK